MKVFTRIFSPVSCHFLFLGPKYAIQNLEKLLQQHQQQQRRRQEFKALISILILSSHSRQTVSFLHMKPPHYILDTGLESR